MKITSLFINITKKSKLLFQESQTTITKKSEDLDKKSNDLAKEKEIDKIKVLTVAEMFGEAIKKIFSNESVSVLF